MEEVAHGELCAHTRDRKPGGFRRERGRAGDPRVHLHDEHLTGLWIHGELDVTAAGFDTDLADDGDGSVPHALILDVRERLGGGHGDGVPRVDAHRVEVLDRAHDDDVVRGIPNDLEFVLLPPDDAPVDEHLGDGRGVEAASDGRPELIGVVGDAATRTPEGEAGADDGRISRVLDDGQRLVHGSCEATMRKLQSDARHGSSEFLAVLRHPDGPGVRPDQLDPVLLEHTLPIEIHRDVERGLSAHRGQQGVGLLPLDHPLDPVGCQRLDVGAVGQIRVRHNRGWVRIHQNHAIALFLQGSHRLGARVVELARLTDDDWA